MNSKSWSAQSLDWACSHCITFSMTKTKFAVLSVLLIIALVLSSCGGGNGTNNSGGNGGGGGYKPPPLSITSLSPSSITVGVSLGNVTIHGTGFNTGSVVLLDGVMFQQNTAYVTANILQVQFPNSLDYAIGVHQITVQGTTTSNSLPFTVYQPQPGPDLMTSMPGYFVGQVSGGAAVVDVNGDGRSDVIISGPNSSTIGISLTILYGQADGTLSVPQYVPIPDTGFPVMAAGDIDGDGKADIVTFTTIAPDALLLTAKLGDGQGNFQTVSTQTSVGNFAGTAYLADLDGDDKLDALLTYSGMAGNGLACFKNLGGGNFAPPGVLASEGNSVDTIYVADFNRDGKPDILYAPLNQPQHILFGTGNGNFTDQPLSPNGVVARAAVLDFDLDGSPDLVLQTPQDPLLVNIPVQVYSFAGKGDGTFTLVATSSLGVPAQPYRVVSGDFDHDGFPDLAGMNNDEIPGHILYLWGDGHGNFTPQQAIGPSGVRPLVGDFNGDGIPDVLAVDGPATYLALGRTDRNVPSAVALTPNLSANVTAGDVDGDGQKEILVGGDAFSSTPATLYQNMGNNTFQLGPNADPNSYALRDLTGRGVADLMGTMSGQLVIWPNNGTLDFSTSTPITVTSPAGVGGGTTVVDLDGDGHPDIISPREIYYGNGAYQFAVNPTPNFGGIFVVGDFNGDGRVDIQTDAVLYLNQGGRALQPLHNSFLLSNITAVATGDLNGDGKDDIAITDPSGGLIVIYYSNGDGTFTQNSFVTCGQYVGTMDIVDMNGDGRKDIVVGMMFQGGCVLFNNGQGLFTRSYFATGAFANLMRVSDINNDGKPDVVILNFPTFVRPPNVDVVFQK